MLLQCFSDSHCLITSDALKGAVLIGMADWHVCAFSNAMYILHWRIRFQDHDDVFIMCIRVYSTIFLVQVPTHKRSNCTHRSPSLSFKTTSFTVTAFDGFCMLRRQWTWCSSCPTSSLWCAKTTPFGENLHGGCGVGGLVLKARNWSCFFF